jgi:hypothetical protein
MEPLQVAARFAAFACYLNGDPAKPRTPQEAGKYARGNWERFLPYVDQDLGRLLTSVPRRLPQNRERLRRKACKAS